ncbi:MAG TPA: polysaccharide pyruvyl transferase family protein [Nitrososphaerales archaeon]|nr:polysaccharide pyruvyl transferase family protein [Nitrososphaerales archaeon]
MRVTIIGSYGYGNLGDELMLDGVLAGIRRTVPEAKITVISGDPKDTSKSHRVHSIGRGGGSSVRLRRFWELVRSDLFLVGGGNVRDQLPGTLQPSQPNALSVWLGQVLLAHEIGVPTMCYAISIGHILTPEGGEVLRDCLGKVDAISVRDSASATRISELGVKREVVVAADAAFSVIPAPQLPATRRGLVISLRHWYEKGNYVEDEETFGRMIHETAEFCDIFFERHGEPIWLVPFKATDADNDCDTVIHKELVDQVRHREGIRLLDRVPDLNTALPIFATARLVLGMRLHSIILATAVGTPWVAISYDPKVRAFAQYAKQDRFSLEVNEVSAQKLSELEKVVSADEKGISKSLGSVSDELRFLERRNAEAASAVLRIRPPESGLRKVVVRSFRLLRHELGQGRTQQP